MDVVTGGAKGGFGLSGLLLKAATPSPSKAGVPAPAPASATPVAGAATSAITPRYDGRGGASVKAKAGLEAGPGPGRSSLSQPSTSIMSGLGLEQQDGADSAAPRPAAPAREPSGHREMELPRAMSGSNGGVRRTPSNRSSRNRVLPEPGGDAVVGFRASGDGGLGQGQGHGWGGAGPGSARGSGNGSGRGSLRLTEPDSHA